jgi:hypothetical protein
MSRARSAAVAAAAIATTAGLVVAGCSATQSARAAGPAAAPPSIGLATAVAGGSGAAWATLPVPGLAGSTATYWQLLVRPAGRAAWRLATPPGVADNAGLVVTGPPGGALTVGFVPADRLTFTPLAVTTDGGGHWSQGLLPERLAARPDALTTLQAGALIAVTARAAEVSGPSGARWRTLVTEAELAASPAGRACGLRALTAAAAPGSVPLLAGDCARPGRVGIFRRVGGGWALADLRLPAGLRTARVTVLRLLTVNGGAAALLAAAGRSGTVLLAASGSGSGWTAGPAIGVGHTAARSASAGPDGDWGVALANSRAVLVGPRTARFLPGRLPGAGATVLPGNPVSALVPGAGTVSVWELSGGGWRRRQTVSIPTGV